MIDRNAPDEELIRHCSRSNPHRDVVHELEGGISVIKISDDAVVKCGIGVTAKEARNQARAYKLIDPAIIRVPQVYRFFASGYAGYIVMEYIEGKSLDSLDASDDVEKMAHTLSQFAQIQNDTPGPLGGGQAMGLLWLDLDWIAPTSVQDIETYYNARQLRRSQQPLDIKNYPLVLCHLDIAPRNVIKMKDGSLCLLDWATAGFYPRLFEICTLRLNRHIDWCSRILEKIKSLSDEEDAQALLLQRAHHLGQKHIYVPKHLGPALPTELRKKRTQMTA